MFNWLWRLLNDERGEVDPEQTAADNADAEAAADESGDTESGEQEESFVDPESVPENIRESAEYKGLVKSYSRAMNRFNGVKDKIEILDRIANDADYRRQFVERAAQQMGLQVVNPNGANGHQQEQQNPALQRLSEYEAAMPGLTDALREIVRAETAPIKQQTEQSMSEAQRRVQQQEWDRAALELTEQDPEWEETSDDIGDLYEFLKSGQMFHPVWGNKLSILHKLARGEDYAAAEAVNRMRSAARNKTHTGRNAGGQISITDIHKQITEAPTAQNKWDIAGKFAIEELKKGGV